ncbi:hypothetical protein CEXT_479091 [Caerostris extrusa]|uniref:Transmembrane protein n=1 Tax=Caerostris extrusa TaxID=172846 RepID=A0AAV4ULC8_CAEEX|nr:hypothetical protein CEXT_479091 [Caerostris extrusa]
MKEPSGQQIYHAYASIDLSYLLMPFLIMMWVLTTWFDLPSGFLKLNSFNFKNPNVIINFKVQILITNSKFYLTVPITIPTVPYSYWFQRTRIIQLHLNSRTLSSTTLNIKPTFANDSSAFPALPLSLYNSLKLYDKLKTRFFFYDHYARRTFFPPRKIYCNDSIVTAFDAPHLCYRKLTPFPPSFVGGLNRSQPSLNSDLRGHKQ